jgi:hypothetical protein
MLSQMLTGTEKILPVRDSTAFRKVAAAITALYHALAVVALSVSGFGPLELEQLDPGIDEIEQKPDDDNENEKAHGVIDTLSCDY